MSACSNLVVTIDSACALCKMFIIYLFIIIIIIIKNSLQLELLSIPSVSRYCWVI